MLYALVCLPLCLSLCVAAIDISGALSLRSELQREADRLALSAAQLLPDQLAARTYLEHTAGRSTTYVLVRDGTDDTGAPRTGLSGLSAEVESRPYLIHDSLIKLTLRSSYRAAFDGFLGGALTFTVERSATAQVVPTDTVVILNDSASLRPPLGTALGDPADWPESGYFRCISMPSPPPSGELREIYSRYLDPDFRRSATQSCFGPILLPLKLAAIGFTDALGAFSLNRVSVLVSPGANPSAGGQFLRRLRGELVTPGGIFFPGQVGGFTDSETKGSEVQPDALGYTELESLLGDEACALFSLFDDFGSGRYLLPRVGETHTLGHAQRSGMEPVAASPCGQLHFPFGRLSREYLAEELSLREAIYWHAARSPSVGASFDLSAAVRLAISELLIVEDNAITAAEVAIRGNSAYQPERRVVVFTNSLPPASPEFLAVLTLLRSLRDYGYPVTLSITVFDPTGTSSAVSLQSLDTTGELLQVNVSQRSEELLQSVLPRLIRTGRNIRIRA